MRDQAKLDQLNQTLAADGYHLELEESGDVIKGVVTSGDGVCDDCLVPQDIMKTILAPILGTQPDKIELTYPPKA